MHEFGLAFDVALVDSEGKYSWNPAADTDADHRPDYMEAGQIGEKMGLIWGGRFSGRDLCHFEWTGGLTLKELKAGISPPQPVRTNINHVKEDKKMGTQTTKQGLRSTEFYLAIMGAMIPVLNTHLGFAIPVEGVLSIAGVIISYIISRTIVKKG